MKPLSRLLRLRFSLPTMAVLLGSTWLGIWSMLPPEPVSDPAPQSEFSSARAMRHLRFIAAEPHPTGSTRNGAVRDYLVNELRGLGLEVQVQIAKESHGSSPNSDFVQVENIIARVPGTVSGRAVVLACHYDSAPLAPGAGDDGAAVAAMVEVARASMYRAPLRNDLMFLLTDAEEAGLRGAKAFASDEALAKSVGVVFNYDARGCAGPSILMETSPGNGRLVREFCRAAPYRLGASLACEIYTYLPNSTDMTVFKRHDLPGLNFCINKGLAHYHRPSDSLENVDEATVQHIGANALALSRHFGNLDLTSLREPDETFFNPAGMLLVHYPAAWNRPIALLVIAAGIALTQLAIRRHKLPVRHLVDGFVASLVIIFCTIVPIFALSAALMRSPTIGSRLVNGDLPEGNLYLAAYTAFAISAGMTFIALYRRQLSAAALSLGGIALWLILTAAACMYFPLACYQVIYPLAVGYIAVGGALYSAGSRTRSLVLQLFATALIVVQAAPVIYLIGLTLGTSRAWAAMLLVVLIEILIVPLWEFASTADRWLIPIASAALGTGLLISAQLSN
jgi:hypothetical protein